MRAMLANLPSVPKIVLPPQSVHSQTPTGQNKATQRDKRMERLQETVKTKSKIKKKKEI